MTQLSRERLENLLQYNDESSSSANAEMWEVREMARRLLAAEAQETVAWRWNYGGTTNWRLQNVEPQEGDNSKCPRIIQALYAAPQPVAVPDEKDKFSPDVKSPYDAGRVRGWNDCRDAMLNAEPVSQPYTLPQWIPCSERKPDNSEPVLILVGYMQTAFWEEDIEMWGWGEERWRPGDVTHWIPLPLAPQESTK